MVGLVLTSHFIIAVVLVSLIFKSDWGGCVIGWAGRHALWLGLIVSLTAVLGSLFYSNIVGFPPCNLCWWQRIFIYPQLVLFLVAVKTSDFKVFRYSVPLAVVASIISIYHMFVQMGGNSILPCSATASCAKLYVYAFGYITIPSMALTISVAILLLAWIRNIYENRHP